MNTHYAAEPVQRLVFDGAILVMGLAVAVAGYFSQEVSWILSAI